jgi:Nucleoside-diphosphate-sugar epimerases
LKCLCDDIDIVFHLAGFAHAYEEENPEFNNIHRQVNYQGTVNILNESIRAGIKRFIYFSSVKATASSDNCIDEDWTAQPSDAYGLAKRQAEHVVLSLCETNNITPVILRPALVYGPGVKGNLAAMIRGVSKGYFPTPPPIQNYKSMISIDDLCHAAFLASQSENPRNKIYILTDGISYSTAQITQSIRVALGKKKSKFYCPLWVWNVLAKAGDIVQRATGRRFPVNTQAVKKLFSSALYRSIYIKNDLKFEPKLTLSDMLPSIMKVRSTHD